MSTISLTGDLSGLGVQLAKVRLFPVDNNPLLPILFATDGTGSFAVDVDDTTMDGTGWFWILQITNVAGTIYQQTVQVGSNNGLTQDYTSLAPAIASGLSVYATSSDLTAEVARAQAAEALAVQAAPLQDFWQFVGGTYFWTIPTGAIWLEIMLCAAGSGGGSGARGAAGKVICGGGGGGAGDILMKRVRVADILATASSTLRITVGVAGIGGASVATDNTNGISSIGNAGPTNVFDSNNYIIGSSYISGPGSGGTIGTSSGTGLGGFSEISWPSGNAAAGTAASTTGGAGTNGNVGYGAGGGASGGGINISSVAALGGLPTWMLMYGHQFGGASQGVVDGAAPVGASAPQHRGIPGLGGTGGWASVTGPAANGVTGILGAGGGGGGASLNGHPSGAGGDGGDGFAWILPHFA